MKRLTPILIALSILSFATANAQDAVPRTKAGDVGLLFTINGFGNFGVFGVQAGSVREDLFGFDTIFSELRLARPILGVGVKGYIADNIALRGALGFGISNKSEVDPNDSTNELTSTQTSVGIAPGLEIHLVNTGAVTAYTGAFFTFALASANSGDGDSERTKTQTRVGGGALLGVEFFPWNGISLGAEYQLGVASSSTTEEVGGTELDRPSFFDIGTSSAAVTLGVFF